MTFLAKRSSESLKGGKVRESNLELCRIIAMLAIILYHYLSQSGLYVDGSQGNMVFGKLIGQYGRVAVDVFLILGVWFMVDAKFKASRIERLWTETFFYGLLFTIFSFVATGSFNLKQIASAALPILGIPVWFVSVYLTLLMLAPFMQFGLSKFSDRSLSSLVAVLFFSVCISATLKDWDNRLTAVLWFVFVYIFVFWFKKRQWRVFENPLMDFVVAVLILGSLAVLSVLPVLLNMSDGPILAVSNIAAQWLHDYKSAPAFLAALLIFEGFLHMRVKQSNAINNIASGALAVYIVHQTQAFVPVLWLQIWHANHFLHANTIIYILYSMVVVVATYLAIAALDFARKKTVHRLWEGCYLQSKVLGLLNRVYAPLAEQECVGRSREVVN